MTNDIDELIKKFSQIETNDTTKMEDMKAQIEALQASLLALTTRLSHIENPNVVKQYEDEIAVTTQASLTSIKALPEFHGKIEEYPSWRNLVTSAMKYIGKNDAQKYLDALLLVKSKIRGPAAAILSNHGTALNFDAIIDRLDYSYADQRAMYVIEQELIVLQQGRMTVHEFYDKINEKLNIIITKVRMTYKEKIASDTLIENMQQKALRTFITGLNDGVGNVLYSSNPKTLAEAYARLQTILSDRERISFATQYNRNEARSNYIQGNRNDGNHNNSLTVDRKTFSPKNRNGNQPVQNVEQRKQYPSVQLNPNFTLNKNAQPFIPSFAPKPNVSGGFVNNNNANEQEAMEVDPSSMNVNIDDNKRKFIPSGSNQNSRQRKFQRVNNIENEANECEEIEDNVDTLSQASIFLDL